MFTLNELYSTSLALTQKFLLYLTASMPKGALLLVVDSPGSYSSVTLNGAEKKYPMQWLLDHTLLKQGPKCDTDTSSWAKLVEDESRWFRLDNRMKYPIELENMRFQLHLYRKMD
jgi:25S rRNA (uracil2843-N3)-methyltransferase